jgi:hypothetical protein
VLTERGEIGTITTGNQYYSTTRDVPLSDQDALLINEVVWDLIVERVITPGIDNLNNEWPWLHVSNMDKLKQMLKKL